MGAVRISIITACWNAEKTLANAMESVAMQQGVELEYIVVDGGSTDASVSQIESFKARHPTLPFRWIPEKDRGMYDALNKGIRLATGDVVGILNADDVLATDDTLAHIASVFRENVDAVYADIRFVRDGDSVEALRSAPTARYCSARIWRPWMFRFGAMVPHPSFYVRRNCFDRLGLYSLDYRICADFELELRFLRCAAIPAVYLPECVVVMRMGGASTAGVRATVEINREDLRALRANGIWSCLPIIYMKYLFKGWGFLRKG